MGQKRIIESNKTIPFVTKAMFAKYYFCFLLFKIRKKYIGWIVIGRDLLLTANPARKTSSTNVNSRLAISQSNCLAHNNKRRSPLPSRRIRAANKIRLSKKNKRIPKVAGPPKSVVLENWQMADAQWLTSTTTFASVIFILAWFLLLLFVVCGLQSRACWIESPLADCVLARRRILRTETRANQQTMSDDNEFQRLEQRLPCRSPFDLFAFRFFYSSLVSNFINFPFFFFGLCLWRRPSYSVWNKNAAADRRPTWSKRTAGGEIRSGFSLLSFFLTVSLSLSVLLCVCVYVRLASSGAEDKKKYRFLQSKRRHISGSMA